MPLQIRSISSMAVSRAGVAEAAQHRHHPGLAGGDVHRVAAGHGAHRQHGGVHGVDAAGHHRLQRGDEIPRAGNGVVGGVGCGAMAALAVYGDVEQIHRTGEVPLIELHPAHRVILGGADMLAEDGVHMGVLHDARRHQRPCAAGHGILAGLEDELHRTRKGVPHMAQGLGRAQQHGGVQVVAAGVHDALRLAGKGHAGLLVDRQRVDVGRGAPRTCRVPCRRGADPPLRWAGAAGSRPCPSSPAPAGSGRWCAPPASPPPDGRGCPAGWPPARRKYDLHTS